MKDVYLGDFTDWESVCQNFQMEEEQPVAVFAVYDYGNYEGAALVLHTADFESFWHVYGSHCSCYGLEGQWDEEEFSHEVLSHMVTNATYGMLKDHRDMITKWMSGK